MFLGCGTNPPVTHAILPGYVGEHPFREYVTLMNVLSHPIGIYVTIKNGEPVEYGTANTGLTFDIDRKADGDISIRINEEVGG